MSDRQRKPLRGTDLKRFHRSVRRDMPGHREITIVAEHINYPANVGSIFRIADAIDADVILAGTTPDPTQPTAAKVARGKHRRTGWSRVETGEEAARDLARRGVVPIALEITEDATPYHKFEWPDRIALVVGNEDHGVTRDALAVCHGVVFVPMLGRGRSLNVHVATAVVAYRALLSVPSRPST